MKTSENKEIKQLRELSEEELKEVTGESSIDWSQPENRVLPICKDRGVNLREILFDDHLEIN